MSLISCPALRPLTPKGIMPPHRRPACAPLDARGPKQSSASRPPRAISRRSDRGRLRPHAAATRCSVCGSRTPSSSAAAAAAATPPPTGPPPPARGARPPVSACARAPPPPPALRACASARRPGTGSPLMVTDTASSPAGTSRQRMQGSSGHAALPRGAPGRPAPSGSSDPPCHKTSGGAPCDSALPCSLTLLRKACPPGGQRRRQHGRSPGLHPITHPTLGCPGVRARLQVSSGGDSAMRATSAASTLQKLSRSAASCAAPGPLSPPSAPSSATSAPAAPAGHLRRGGPSGCALGRHKIISGCYAVAMLTPAQP